MRQSSLMLCFTILHAVETLLGPMKFNLREEGAGLQEIMHVESQEWYHERR